MTTAHARSVGSRRSLLRGLGALGVAGALSGCTRVLGTVAELGSDVTVRPDLAYGPDPRHRLDLYLPAGAHAGTPLVLFLYGSSWRWGARGRYRFAGYGLAERGLAVAVADYRLYPAVKFPVFNEDAARAASWLQRSRKALGFAPGPLHLTGHSAGAHMAASLLLDRRYMADAGGRHEDLGRLVGLAGPYALQPSKIDFIADIFRPAMPETLAMPVELARGDIPPVLLLHGGDDGLVPAVNSHALAAAITAKGGQAEARIYPDLGHRGAVLALSRPFQGLAPVLEDTVNFLAAA